MNMIESTKRIAWTALALAAVLLVGMPAAADAEAQAPKATSDAEMLRERVSQYWDARIAQAPESLDFYAKTSSGKPPRDVPDFGSIRYASYQIEKIEVDGNEGRVLISVPPADLKLPVSSLPEIKRRPQIREAWVKVEGTWYKKPVDRSLSRVFSRRMRGVEKDLKGEK